MAGADRGAQRSALAPEQAREGGPVVFVRRGARAPRAADAYRRAILMTLTRAAPHVRGEVTLVFATDRTLRRLNRRYRGQDRATDVLSFQLGDGARPGEPFGDIVVSVDAARRQAREYGATTQSEIARLVVHGALHLCGYDHHERREAARMHALTRSLLRALAKD